jgi:hypothetical protein
VGTTDLGIVTGGPLSDAYGGYCYYPASRSLGFAGATQPHVTYPFNSPLSPEIVFERSTTPWSGSSREWDISFDGVLHIGMIPDFVQELRVMGLTDADLEPLWHGAEAYIRTWELSMSWHGPFRTEDAKGIKDDCTTLRKEVLKLDWESDALGRLRDGDVDAWINVSTQLKQKGCAGF